jgi:hypothetical protein
MSDYSGPERRAPRRRAGDNIQKVELEHLSNGAKWRVDFALKISTGILITLICGFPVTWWGVSQWVAETRNLIQQNSQTVQMIGDELLKMDMRHEEKLADLKIDSRDHDDDLVEAINATSEALQATSETVREIAAEQRALRRDVTELRGDVRSIRDDM